MSLYRKYRPQSFSDVVGQDHVVTTLENAVSQDKLAHAYLFAGPRGTGKTSAARILAKHILTRGLTDETLKRQVEQAVAEGTLVDLIEIDAASNTGVDNIRDLIEKVQFTPVVAAAKVYLIDEVHMLSKGAFNALLKTLEEPPAYAYFILATTELQKIPATIQSRCQRFAFRQISEEDIVRRLQYIADREKITVERTALRIVARHAQGGMRDAISLLDQLRSLPSITLADVEERLGETGREHVEALLRSVEEGNRPELLRRIREIEDDGAPLDIFVRQLLAEVRRRLHARIGAGEGVERLTAMLDSLLQAIRDLRSAPVPGLALEAALLALCAPSSDVSSKKKSRYPAPPAASRETLPEAVEQAKDKALAKDALVEAPEVTLASVQAAWPSILAAATPAALRMSLKNGRVTAVEGTHVTLSFASNFHRERVTQKEGLHNLEQVLQDHFKRPLRLRCILAEEEGAEPVADPAMVDLAEAVKEIF